MKPEVLLCGCTFHTKRFYQSHADPGLSSYLIRLQTEGTCTVIVEGREYKLVPGDLLLLRPGTVYELRIEEEAANTALEETPRIISGDYYMFAQGEWLDAWWNGTEKPWRVKIEPNDAILSLWKQIILEKCRIKEDNFELISHLMRALCLYLERIISETSPAYHKPYMAARMKRYVEAHAIETFTVEEVAKYVGLSVSRAAHLFKESYGKTMIQYAMDIRLTGAVDRMNYTNMTLGQISDSCGFRSYTFFHKAFKEKYGVTPAVFRSNIREMQLSARDK
ncbi:AraC family transcriptional regulator [Paenibacillus allorhizosphaerae]|uniref:Arabinose operon regulatory protein n=1 Tax=Paenibacillus allorhizosphaerae TaxID=2849866 RepID=A0ABM8VB56_9BACL|nr:AraC family transcriptional regulator [Paenibacillus allorhizosphaerae]CAG7618498.1 Arabinose operon regulatory protein [Paenibacillus allorhizosphaerae]